ncbi:CBU_0592 family membrane protein [Myceligenerans halotolerans]
MTTVVTALGWVGAVAGLVAYAMVSQGKWRPDSIAFQATNVSAASILMAVAALNGVWPSAASNIAAIAIGGNALFMVARARGRKARDEGSDIPAIAPTMDAQSAVRSTLR